MERLSFMIHCETQEEIDYYWNALSAVPEAEQCGWLKDKFGHYVPDFDALRAAPTRHRDRGRLRLPQRVHR